MQYKISITVITSNNVATYPMHKKKEVPESLHMYNRPPSQVIK